MPSGLVGVTAVVYAARASFVRIIFLPLLRLYSPAAGINLCAYPAYLQTSPDFVILVRISPSNRLVFHGGVNIYSIGLPQEGADHWI